MGNFHQDGRDTIEISLLSKYGSAQGNNHVYGFLLCSTSPWAKHNKQNDNLIDFAKHDYLKSSNTKNN